MDRGRWSGAVLVVLLALLALPLAAKGQGLTQVQSIRHWSTGDYTRVVVELAAAVSHRHGVLPASGDLPPRLYLDLLAVSLPAELRQPIPVADGLLRQVRAGQFAPDVVRVVLDLESLAGFEIFDLPAPQRLVIDIRGKGQAGPASAKARPPAPAPSPAPAPLRIVLDPGHGGKDPGAVGVGGLLEKDVVLAVAKRAAERLRREMGCKVILTRDRDVFLALEERTALANAAKGDLFVSIHANAAPSADLRGIETYFLSPASGDDALRVAARENAAASAKAMGDLQAILLDLLRNSKLNESARLAEAVQASLVDGLRRQYPDVPNLGVKQAPFYVLIGAQMPAVLAEISFVSNPVEARRLQDAAYTDAIAAHLTSGISSYVGKTTVALLAPPTRRPLP
ncbi:MAG: N-acetylmuramoyl-L-alanine amidase [Thermodesulfobacteriota bacterium]